MEKMLIQSSTNHRVPPSEGSLPSTSETQVLRALSVEEEIGIIARGESGAKDTLLVRMKDKAGSCTFLPGEERWCVTPSLGICQAVLLASYSPSGGGRLSLTHFSPVNCVEHRKTLHDLCALHADPQYSEHLVVYALPLKDYSGRYLHSIRSQHELLAELQAGVSTLGSHHQQIVWYSHEEPIECPRVRSAFIAHLSAGPGARLSVDMVGFTPCIVWQEQLLRGTNRIW